MPKFVPRERKHKRLARNKDPRQNANDGANQEEIVPLTKNEKEERRQKLRDEIHAQQPDKVSGKKKKRLDKYIETKLKKEENLDLLKKLAAQKIDTSLLQSSKKLGRVSESKKERLQRALSERQAGVDVNGDQDAILFEHRQPSPQNDLSDHANELSDQEETKGARSAPQHAPVPSAQNALSFGSGLKRPLEIDESGQPVIKMRKRQKKSPKFNLPVREASDEEEDQDEQSEDEWAGFDSNNDSEDGLEETESEPSSGSDDSEINDGDSDSVEDTDSDEGGETEGPGDKPARVSAFKAWADSQRNEAVGFTPSVAPTEDKAIRASFKPRAPSPDPVSAELVASVKVDSYRPSTAVAVPRSEEVQAARLELPVVQDEQKIMEAIHNNPVTVVCGATGSGKTTQLPQILLENGYASTGMIGITQPRRVAATSVASRVAHELGTEFGRQVAHQVRYDTNVSRDTKIKFMTDGILLREISQDFALTKYSAIVIDEAHERSVNTDILIGMLSRIVPLRQELSREDPSKHHPLKLIVMSATLRVTDFIMNHRLFKSSKPPIVQAEGRQYPVTEHFARRTQRDYVTETVHKVSKGHRKLPPGGILVFLTGQDEITTVAKRLKEAFAVETTGFQNSRSLNAPKRQNDYLEEEEQGEESDSEPEITGLDDDDEAEDREFEVEVDPSLPQRSGVLKPHILSLYAALPTSQQMKVFQPAPEGSRPIILATNVAETSLTIPGTRYVFDCGRSKEKQYDTTTGVQEFKVDWISKASASQRAGRAGRTGPGHCYRLYSSAIYEQYFEEHSLPEISRTPIEGTVLQLKNMDVDNVVNFPFPTPPQREQLSQAERLLKNLGAIDAKLGRVTDIGKELIHYPVNPRFGKMLLLGARNSVTAHTIALVAGLAVSDLFIAEPQLATKTASGAADDVDSDSDAEKTSKASNLHASDAAQARRQAYGRAQATLSAWDDKSDAIKLLTAVAAHAQAGVEGSKSFCAEYFLREKGMEEVQQLRRQLHNIVQVHVKDGQDTSFKPMLPPPSQKEISVLKQIVAAGYIDQVAVRADLLPSTVSGRKPRRAIEVAYRTLFPSISEAEIDRSASPEDQAYLRSAFVHSGSVLAKVSVSEMPPYIIYSNLSRATASTEGEKKRVRLHPLTTVGPKQLGALAEGTPLLEIGKPIGKIEEKEAGKKRECWVGVSLREPSTVGSTGWPLGAWKVLQSRKTKEWEIEKVIDRGR